MKLCGGEVTEERGDSEHETQVSSAKGKGQARAALLRAAHRLLARLGHLIVVVLVGDLRLLQLLHHVPLLLFVVAVVGGTRGFR